MLAPRLIYPPHPAITWMPRDLHRIRMSGGFVAQYKYDDWRTLVYFLPDGSIRFYSRKRALLPRYHPPESLLKSLHGLKLRPRKLHVLDGGLMHYKTPRLKDTLVLWDILVHEDRYLLGTTFDERYRLLSRVCGEPTTKVFLSSPESPRSRIFVGLRIARHLWLAPLLRGDPATLFEGVRGVPEIEGLVLKNRRAKLERSYRPEENAAWQIRVRKPRVNYRF